jgi:hypothetical protein
MFIFSPIEQQEEGTARPISTDVNIRQYDHDQHPLDDQDTVNIRMMSKWNFDVSNYLFDILILDLSMKMDEDVHCTSAVAISGS